MNRDVQLFRALGYEIRLSILEMLHDQDGTLTVDRLLGLLREQDTTIEQPSLSHHLRALREAGIVDFHKHGQYCYYFICPEVEARAKYLVKHYIGNGGNRDQL